MHIPVGVEHEFTNLGNDEFIYLSFKNKSEDWLPPSALPDEEVAQPHEGNGPHGSEFAVPIDGCARSGCR